MPNAFEAKKEATVSSRTTEVHTESNRQPQRNSRNTVVRKLEEGFFISKFSHLKWELSLDPI